MTDRLNVLVAILVTTLALPAAAWAKKCPKDSVAVGPVCVDTYEASVWTTTDAALVKKIQKGRIMDAADLAGATQQGVASDDYGAGCPDTGNGCVDSYAVSVPGVTPSADITWFQATAACRNAGKRLATNQEWQQAALGTPDGAPCIVSGVAAGQTGTAGCVSDVGAFDMVGNLSEWVADWVPASTTCPGWGGVSDDVMCLSGASTGTLGPGALLRGGNFFSISVGAIAGVFAVDGRVEPWSSSGGIGFRCARQP